MSTDFSPEITLNLLNELTHLLSNLPESIPQSEGGYYPFLGYRPNLEWVESTGSRQGALNRVLEHTFGSRHERISTGQTPVEFHCQGPDLLAIVDVLQSHLTGNSPEDILLVKWLQDLITSAKAIQQILVPAIAPAGRLKNENSRIPKKKHARSKKGNRIATSNLTEKAKIRTQKIPNYNPTKLKDNVPSKTSRGRKPSPLLQKLTIKCHDDHDRERVRCSGNGCTESWSGSPQSRFILPHAKGCQFLPSELREEARKALRELAPSVQLANIGDSEAHSQEKSHIQATKRKLTGDDLLVRLICSEFLRPTLVDSDAFRAYVNHLDPATKVINSTTCVKLIHAEAEAVVQISIDTLQQQQHLSLSFDGSTLRGSQSVYTMHITPPNTRQAHLIEGSEASGESHTAVHIKGVLLKAINAIDASAKLFSSLSSDSTGNTRLARELLAELFPWLIIIPDPCHHLNNCAKDIGSLLYVKEAIHKLREVIRYFSKSTYAGHHLTALRVFWGIAQGLVKPAKTRFLTIYHAIHAFLPCLPPILELIETNVVKISRGHKLAWMKDIIQLRSFKDQLRQLHATVESHGTGN